MNKRDYDAVVAGSGPNGLAAAIVLIVEAKDVSSGQRRSATLTLPGFIHNVCFDIHPLTVGFFFLKPLPWNSIGWNLSIQLLLQLIFLMMAGVQFCIEQWNKPRKL